MFLHDALLSLVMQVNCKAQDNKAGIYPFKVLQKQHLNRYALNTYILKIFMITNEGFSKTYTLVKTIELEKILYLSK